MERQALEATSIRGFSGTSGMDDIVVPKKTQHFLRLPVSTVLLFMRVTQHCSSFQQYSFLVASNCNVELTARRFTEVICTTDPFESYTCIPWRIEPIGFGLDGILLL